MGIRGEGGAQSQDYPIITGHRERVGGGDHRGRGPRECWTRKRCSGMKEGMRKNGVS